jgi:hypothetical protein
MYSLLYPYFFFFSTDSNAFLFVGTDCGIPLQNFEARFFFGYPFLVNHAPRHLCWNNTEGISLSRSGSSALLTLRDTPKQRKQQHKNLLSVLPREIQHEILKYLSARDLLALGATSRQLYQLWYDLSSLVIIFRENSRYFSEKHLRGMPSGFSF